MASARVKDWSVQRKYKAGIAKILDEDWSVSETARYYGVSRSNLSRRVAIAREERAEAEERAAEEVATGAVSSLVPQQIRDVGTFEEFFNRYFGSWVCPDCHVHHEMPDFHREIIDAVESDHRRVLVNLPPYHSKSTLITVWHTVYDICRNPNSRTIIVSKSGPFAKAFLHAIKEILSNEELYENSEGNLIQDWGPFKPDQGGWSEYEIYVANRTGAEKDPTVLAMGYGGQIYGRRADKIKFDDIATLDNQRNPDRVAHMIEWINKEALSRIGKSGQAIWAGTRVSAGDIYSVLGARQGYKVIRYPALIDDETEQVLWPEHFPYAQVLTHRGEMSPSDFQLVYQNVDVPGLHASFTQEMMDLAKDTSRVVGHYTNGWRLIAGLDPAGANKNSGRTAMVLLAVDPDTGKRFVVDAISERQMKAPRMRDVIFDWSSKYPIYEWRVESNGVQSQLVQYNEEIVQHLAKRGIRVLPHQTNASGRTGKWDAEFGVETMAPLFHAELVSIPWAGVQSAQAMQKILEEFVSFPMGIESDLVMAFWFAELGVRQLLNRAHLPMFNNRMRKNWPNRIKRRAAVADFESRTVRGVSIEDQRLGHLSRGQHGYRRMTVGQPTAHADVEEYDAEVHEGPLNVDPRIWTPS